MKEAFKLLKDEKRIMQWQKHVTEFKVYPLPTDTAWYEYSYHDIPWPVSDQDHFLVYRIENNDYNSIFVTFESITNERMPPVRDGVARMNLVGTGLFKKFQLPK